VKAATKAVCRPRDGRLSASQIECGGRQALGNRQQAGVGGPASIGCWVNRRRWRLDVDHRLNTLQPDPLPLLIAAFYQGRKWPYPPMVFGPIGGARANAASRFVSAPNQPAVPRLPVLPPDIDPHRNGYTALCERWPIVQPAFPAKRPHEPRSVAVCVVAECSAAKAAWVANLSQPAAIPCIAARAKGLASSRQPLWLPRASHCSGVPGLDIPDR
jgi:hypothetical protein